SSSLVAIIEGGKAIFSKAFRILSVKGICSFVKFLLAGSFMIEKDPDFTRPVIGEIKARPETSKSKAPMPRILRIFESFIRARAARDKREPAESDKIKISPLLSLSLEEFS